MKHLFKPHIINSIILVLIVALAVKIVWLIVSLTLLDARGVEYTKSSKVKSLYYRTRFENNRGKSKKVQKVKMSDISSFNLLGIYHSADTIVVTVSKAGKSSVLVKGGDIDGYVLDDATAEEAIFLRNGKKYRLQLMKPSSSVTSRESVHYTSIEKTPDTIIAKKDSKRPEGEIIEDGDITTIDKSLISHYGKTSMISGRT